MDEALLTTGLGLNYSLLHIWRSLSHIPSAFSWQKNPQIVSAKGSVQSWSISLDHVTLSVREGLIVSPHLTRSCGPCCLCCSKKSVFYKCNEITRQRMFPLCYNSIDSLILINCCAIFYYFSLTHMHSAAAQCLHLSLVIVSLGCRADTGLHAPGFLWTRHFPKITWAKDFHSRAGWGPAEAACLMGNRRKRAGSRHLLRSIALCYMSIVSYYTVDERNRDQQCENSVFFKCTQRIKNQTQGAQLAW